ncbi:MAG: methyl-accepting chemotaxis protein, partial [Burkholderiaceae bacterium]|nr:methyl-accepting chemotaxis protein [Burkholderiaceae bacterium]
RTPASTAPRSPMAAPAYSAQRSALPNSSKAGTAKPRASLSAPKPGAAAKAKAQSPGSAPVTAKGGDEDWESF